jgi:hypothetical protein
MTGQEQCQSYLFRDGLLQAGAGWEPGGYRGKKGYTKQGPRGERDDEFFYRRMRGL